MIGLLLLLLAADSCLTDEHVPRVKTPLGSVRGYYRKSGNGRLFQAYEGIPFARPPTGKRRFKAPEPVSAWPGELPATKVAHACLQYDHLPVHVAGERVVGSEDCLYLNVYVPEPETDAGPLPVIFGIFGGAFMHGHGGAIGPKYLMDKDVIYVTFNHRVGPLGFLSTEDEVVPGNMGLKDQSLALRWVHDNIESFGGDPDRVTLAGISSGGASAHYHYLSPLSKGLFRNGLSLSGNALLSWAQMENALGKVQKLGALLGCPTNCSKKMVKCLRSRPGRAIVDAVKEFTPWLYIPFAPFGPVVERSGDKPFIDRPPMEVLASGDVLDVPWITSATSEEGLYPVSEIASSDELLRELDEKWTSLAPHLLNFNYTVPPEAHVATAVKIRDHYMGSSPISRRSLSKLTKMVGDRNFVVAAELAARMQARVNKSPVWFYYFSYRGVFSLSDTFSGTKENFGVSHADDALYIAENFYTDPTTTENDRAMQNDLIRLWTSLADKGEQELTPKWKRVDPSEKDLHYLHISGPGKFKMASDGNFGNKKFWSTIKFAENILKSSNSKDEL